MNTPFDDYTYSDAQTVVAKRLDAATFQSNRAFYHGDHWQKGDGWIGPKPSDNDTDAESVWAEIEAGFVSKNAAREVVDRHANAVLSQEPDWDVTPRRALKADEQPTTAEQSLIDEANAALMTWWNEKEILKLLQDALAKALWGERACLRLYVPIGLTERDDDAQTVAVPKGTLEESFARLHLEIVEADRGAIERDIDTQSKIGVYLFQDVTPLIAGQTQHANFAELHYLDENHRAVIRRVGEKEDQQIALDLNQRLAFYELCLPPFLTEQVRSNNKLLNMALTMLARNVVLGGFLERVLLNAQLPGEWVDDPTRPGTKMFQPREFKVGAGSTNALAGLPIYGEPTRPGVITGYANPSVVYRDPVAIDTFVGTKAEAYQAVLEEVHQLHALIAGDATASGESRKQAEKDFLKSLRKTINAVNDAVRWLLETSLAMAANFSEQTNRFDELRATSTCNTDAAEITSGDIEDAIKLKDAKLLAPTTAMARVGVADPSAESTKVQAEMPVQKEPPMPPIPQ